MGFNVEFQHAPLETLMSAADALAIYNHLEANGINIWLDGGWAVDAQLGEQTRRHNDIDIVIEAIDIQKFRELLAKDGYAHVPKNGDKPHNFVLGDNNGHEIDAHVIVMDGQGNGIFGPLQDNDMWPAVSLQSFGSIYGQPVRAVSPEYLVQFHTGYEVDADDWHDVRLLCEKFNIEIPADYGLFRKS